jgi:hypothetical protein
MSPAASAQALASVQKRGPSCLGQHQDCPTLPKVRFKGERGVDLPGDLTLEPPCVWAARLFGLAANPRTEPGGGSVAGSGLRFERVALGVLN